ncbi:type II secretion system F family protein [Phytoactinopolyspora endophytica]|uniref:type II secretion system F family protein n=1 Tax=Phytoactinopolyspora endophytica TaxID=1642495 RepID=UPI00101CF11E|nr:type II secretion system F family protein [Phytoactinopolyspora endophytica]
MLSFAAIMAAGVAAAFFIGPAPAKARMMHVVPRRTGRADRGSGYRTGPPEHPGRGSDPSGTALGTSPDGLLSSARGRLLAALLAGLGCSLMVGGVTGMIAGLAAGIGAWYGIGRLEPVAERRAREQVEAQLPLAADLLASVLAAGCPPDRAVEHVGRALGGALGSLFVAAAASARVTTDSARAWSVLTGHPALMPLGRALASAASRGTSPVPALERSAQDARDRARWSAETRSRSLGARAAAPLGLCFLPAFVLVGIIPIIAGSGILAN